ncbi:MAG: hypothetical protein M1451_12395, partial [Acidobacteria bacterium]|nr:hypothetical protein [Acidobacteriota bacterium]
MSFADKKGIHRFAGKSPAEKNSQITQIRIKGKNGTADFASKSPAEKITDFADENKKAGHGPGGITAFP